MTPDNPKQRLILPFFLLALLLILVCALLTLTQGRFATGLADLPAALMDRAEVTDTGFAVRQLRLPRAVMAVLAGAALGVAGALMQAMTRNPLADPGLTGVTAGAAFAVVLGFTLLGVPQGGLLILGTVGGALSGALTFALAAQRGFNPAHLILAGVAVAAFCLSGINVLLLLGATSMNSAWFWLVGGLANRTWQDVGYLWPMVLPVLILAWLLSRRLDLLLLDDDTSRGIGLHAGRWRLIFGLCSVVLTAGCVATCGPIGFIGLLAPHVARMGLGGAVAHRLLIPASALAGAAILSVADALAASRLIFPTEIPTGIPAILIGAGMFLLLFRNGLRVGR